MPIDPIAAGLLQQMAEAGAPPLNELSPAEARLSAEGFLALAGEKEEVDSAVEMTFPGPGGKVAVTVYTPKGAPAGPLGCLVYYHGGGWVLGDREGVDPTLRKLANEAKCKVVSVEYRLAPEHKFPAPLDDCYAALQWVAANGKSLGVDPNRLAVGGDSAGGNLAAGVAIKARDTGDVNLAFQLLIYPCNDNKMKYGSAYSSATGYGLSTQSMEWFWEQYLSKKSDAKNPYAVPAAAKDFRGLAPAIITTAEFDPLLDDGYNYAELLRKFGVPTVYREYDGVIHGYFTLAGITPEAEVLQQFVSDEINAILR